MSEKREAKEEILKGLFEASRATLCSLNSEAVLQSAQQLHKLVQAGRLSADQAKKLESHLQVQMRRVRQAFDQQVLQAANELAAKLQKLAKDELAEVQGRLAKIETHPRLGPVAKQL